MSNSARYLNSSEAARQLGVSMKALRLYEQRGLIAPSRSLAGWRAYSPHDMSRASEIVTLRALGLSLAQVGQALSGDAQALSPALAEHQRALELQIGQLAGAIERVRGLQAELTAGRLPARAELAQLLARKSTGGVAFDLPWPWGGERFDLANIGAINFITGPLASGKTRLARRIAEALPHGRFIGLERLTERTAPAQLAENAGLRQRVETSLQWLAGDGAEPGAALTELVALLEGAGGEVLVIDMVEQGLDQASQEALMAHLRRRPAGASALFLMTRSTAILDMAAVGPGENVIFCPANHSPPMLVPPYPGAPGYEAIGSCLASPDVRARSADVVAIRTGPSAVSPR